MPNLKSIYDKGKNRIINNYNKDTLDEINQNEDYTPLHELVNQPNLMQFMSFEIEAEDEDGESLDEETRTQLFIVTASMIAVLNSAIVK